MHKDRPGLGLGPIGLLRRNSIKKLFMRNILCSVEKKKNLFKVALIFSFFICRDFQLITLMVLTLIGCRNKLCGFHNLLIIIIIAPLSILSEDEWGDLEYKACQSAITDGGLFTYTGVDERSENERQSENDCDMKTVSEVKGPEKTRVGAKD